MARVNVFLSDQLLDEINEEAKKQGIKRSALIQIALENYIEGKRHAGKEEQKQRKRQDASRKMDALAKKLGKWDRSSSDSEFRESNLKDDS